MAAKAYTTPAQVEHVFHIAANMREADRLEVWRAAHQTPLDALMQAFRLTLNPVTVMTPEDEPVAMFGACGATLSSRGTPWLLGTPGIGRIKREFLAECKGYLDEMLNVYPELFNVVDAENEVSIKWLKWLGFEIDGAVRCGPENCLFHPFRKRRS